MINRSQMLIIGGTFPLDDDACDAPPPKWGTHNLVLGQQADPDAAPWQLYSPGLTAYAVPSAVISAVGGQRTGGAARTAPEGGFDNPDLRVLMTKTASIAARTPTRGVPGGNGSTSSTSASSSQGGTRLSTGAIAGIAALAGLCLMARRRHRFRYGAAGALPRPRPRPPGPKFSAGGSSAAYPYDGPFARRPTNINIQQRGRSASSGGGATVLAHGEGQPGLDDPGRPWSSACQWGGRWAVAVPPAAAAALGIVPWRVRRV